MTLAFIGVSTIRISLILVAGLAVARLSRGRSASLRHAVLATAVCGAVVVPVLGTALPSWHLNWLSSLPAVATSPPSSSGSVSVETAFGAPPHLGPVTTQANGLPGPSPARLPRLLFWIWTAGVLLTGLNLLAGLVRLRSLSSKTHVVNSGPWIEGLRDVDADARC